MRLTESFLDELESFGTDEPAQRSVENCFRDVRKKNFIREALRAAEADYIKRPQ